MSNFETDFATNDTAMDVNDFSEYFNETFSETSAFTPAMNLPGSSSFNGLSMAFGGLTCRNDSQAVKTELKKAIEVKKIAKGEEIPTVEYKEPPTPQPRPPEKPEDLMKKREKNKIAASKCRQKKRKYKEYLREKIPKLQDAQHRTLNEVRRLRAEKDKLIGYMQGHTCILQGNRAAAFQPQPRPDLAALVHHQETTTTIGDLLFSGQSSLFNS